MMAVGFGLWGCAGRTAYQHGVEAEKRGEAHLAYAYYATAAQSSPDNRSYDRAIRRLGPMAATHWMTEAKLARAEGRYGDAWKACMRSLAIQPDRSEALSFYDDLQSRYGPRLAGVERQWKQTGGKALAIEVSPKTPAGRAELPESRPDLRDTEKPEEAASRMAPPAINRPVRDVDDADASGEFVAVHKLSRDGDREVTSVDGLVIRFRQTSNNLSVDFDLFDGDRRVQKIRELKAGNSRLLLSPRGTWYRLSVLKVDHAAESAEIGLNPA